MYDMDTGDSRITLGVPHIGPIPTDQFTPAREWEPCAVPVYKYDMRDDGFCLAEAVPPPTISLPIVNVTSTQWRPLWSAQQLTWPRAPQTTEAARCE